MIRAQQAGLAVEWDAAGVARELEHVVGEAVDVYWRRGRSSLTRDTPQRAVITRVNLDGTVDVQFDDRWRETKVERRFYCRSGERNYVPGVGGDGLNVGRLEALSARWTTTPHLASEVRSLKRIVRQVRRRPAWESRFGAGARRETRPRPQRVCTPRAYGEAPSGAV